MSNALLGLGTRFRRNGVTIAEVVTITVAGNNRQPIDVTSHDSTAPAKEFIPGLLDAASVNLTLNFLPGNSTQQSLTTDLENSGLVTAIPQTFSIVFPDGPLTTWTFTAFVTEVGPVSKVDDKLQSTVSVKITRSISIA